MIIFNKCINIFKNESIFISLIYLSIISLQIPTSSLLIISLCKFKYNLILKNEIINFLLLE